MSRAQARENWRVVVSKAVESRQCCGCRQTKPASAFWRDKSKTCGLSTYCKECMKAQYRNRRFPRLKDNPSYQASHRAAQRTYAENHPEVTLAHRKARTHRDKIKSKHCEHCGTTDGKLHMHHPDHSRPLEVVTLCVRCHEEAHHGRAA